jgi:protein TonB
LRTTRDAAAQLALGASVSNVDARLALAVLVSAALHASLIFGVAVRPPDVTPASESILARIQAVPDAAARRPVSPPPAPREPQPARLPAVEPRAQSSGSSAVQHPPAAATAALPAVEMPLLADPTWYPAAQLDVFPAALAPVRPAYPQAAAQADIGGEVTLLLLIDESGRVHESTALDAQPEGTFEEAALAAFRAARFTPGQRDGRNVRSRVLVKVVFDPAEAGAAVSR